MSIRSTARLLLQLEGDAITVSTRSPLAFDAILDDDIRLVGNAGLLAGGLFNLLVQGQGTVAVSSDGAPMLPDCSRRPTFVDSQAAICWSANLRPQVESPLRIGSFVGRGSEESFRLGFHGAGFVVVRPSEGQPVVVASSWGRMGPGPGLGRGRWSGRADDDAGCGTTTPEGPSALC